MKELNIKTHASRKVGAFSVLVYCTSFFIWTGGLMYSVWLGLAALLWSRFVDQRPLRPFNNVLGLLLLMGFFSPIVSDLVNLPNTGSVSAFDRLSYLMMSFVLWEFIDSDKLYKWCVWLVLGSFFVSCLAALPDLFQWLNGSSLRVQSFYDIMRYGHMIGPFLTALFGAVLLMDFGKNKKIILSAMLLLGVIILIANNTRGVMLTAAFGGGLLVCCRPKAGCILGVLILITWFMLPASTKMNAQKRVLSSFDTSQKASRSNQLRLLFWRSAWHSFQGNPVFGVGTKGTALKDREYLKGIGKIDYVYKYYGKTLGNTHNSYLALLAKYGAFGALPFLILLLVYLPINLVKQIYLNFNRKENFILLVSLAVICLAAVTENVLLSKSAHIVALQVFLFQKFSSLNKGASFLPA